MSLLACSLLVLPGFQDAPVRFEPGTQWTYAGRYRSAAAGRVDSERDFPVRSTYLALPGPEPDELYVLLWMSFGEGLSSFRGEDQVLEPREWGTFLHLAPDLRVKTSLLPRRYEHPAASDLEFSPFPPPRTPFAPKRAVSQVRTVKAGLFDYRGEWEWSVEAREGAVRAALKPRSVPVPELRRGEQQELSAFAESFEVDPARQLLTGYAVSHRQRERMPGQKETAWEYDVSLALVERKTLPADVVEEYAAELEAVRDLLFALSFDEAGSGPGQTEVTELLECLDGSPVRSIARDLLEPALAFGEPVEEHQVWYADDAASLAGSPAPAFAGTDLDGNRVTLEQQRGKVVLLNFWASW